MNLNRYYSDYDRGFMLLAVSSDFLSWLKAPYGVSWDLKDYYDRMVQNYVQPLITHHPEIVSFVFYNDNGNEIAFTNQFALSAAYTIRNEPWFDSIRKSDRELVITGNSSDYLDGQTPIKVPVMTFVKRVRQGILKMDVSLRPSSELLSDSRIGSTGEMLIADASGKIVASSDPAKVMSRLSPDKYHFAEYRGDNHCVADSQNGSTALCRL